MADGVNSKDPPAARGAADAKSKLIKKETQINIHYYETFCNNASKSGRVLSQSMLIAAKASLKTKSSIVQKYQQNKHALTQRVEAFLDPSIIEYRIYGLLWNLDIHFTPESFPETKYLGELPAAVYGNGMVAKGELADLFNAYQPEIYDDCIRNNSELGKTAYGTSATELEHLDRMYSSMIRKRLAYVLNYLLWVHEPCYNGYTRPVILESSPVVFALPFLFKQRKRFLDEYQGADLFSMLSEFADVLELLIEVSQRYMAKGIVKQDYKRSYSVKWKNSTGPNPPIINPQKAGPSFLLGSRLLLTDIVAYSFFSVIFNIPKHVLPWNSEIAMKMKASREMVRMEKLNHPTAQYVHIGDDFRGDSTMIYSRLEHTVSWARTYSATIDNYIGAYVVMVSMPASQDAVALLPDTPNSSVSSKTDMDHNYSKMLNIEPYPWTPNRANGAAVQVIETKQHPSDERVHVQLKTHLLFIASFLAATVLIVKWRNA